MKKIICSFYLLFLSLYVFSQDINKTFLVDGEEMTFTLYSSREEERDNLGRLQMVKTTKYTEDGTKTYIDQNGPFNNQYLAFYENDELQYETTIRVGSYITYENYSNDGETVTYIDKYLKPYKIKYSNSTTGNSQINYWYDKEKGAYYELDAFGNKNYFFYNERDEYEKISDDNFSIKYNKYHNLIAYYVNNKIYIAEYDKNNRILSYLKTYIRQDNLSEVDCPNSDQGVYKYNKDGLLISYYVSHIYGGEKTEEIYENIYDEKNRLIQINFNDYVTKNEYDDNNKLLRSVTYNDNGYVTYEEEYEYDENSNCTMKRKYDGNKDTVMFYEYDRNNNVIYQKCIISKDGVTDIIYYINDIKYEYYYCIIKKVKEYSYRCEIVVETEDY